MSRWRWSPSLSAPCSSWSLQASSFPTRLCVACSASRPSFPPHRLSSRLHSRRFPSWRVGNPLGLSSCSRSWRSLDCKTLSMGLCSPSLGRWLLCSPLLWNARASRWASPAPRALWGLRRRRTAEPRLRCGSGYTCKTSCSWSSRRSAGLPYAPIAIPCGPPSSAPKRPSARARRWRLVASRRSASASLARSTTSRPIHFRRSASRLQQPSA